MKAQYQLNWINRQAAEKELAAKGRTLADYPWPEDGARHSPKLAAAGFCLCNACLDHRYDFMKKQRRFNGEY